MRHIFKNRWLSISVRVRWFIIIATLIAIYYYSFNYNVKKTFTTVNEYKLLKSYAKNREADSISWNDSSQSEVLKRSFLKIQKSSLLQTIAEYCEYNELNITEIAQYSQPGIDHYLIETNKLIVTGTYDDILQLLYYIEYDKQIATVNSVSIELSHEKSNNSYSLVATFYIKYLSYEVS